MKSSSDFLKEATAQYTNLPPLTTLMPQFTLPTSIPTKIAIVIRIVQAEGCLI